jgi:hypothetical protein
LGRIPVRSSGGGSVSRGGRKGKVAGGRGGLIGFVVAPGLQKRGKRREKGVVTAAPRTAGGEVAAGERSGRLWRARGKTAGLG